MEEPFKPKPLIEKIKEAAGFILAGAIFIAATYYFFPIIMFIIKLVLYAIGGILVLAGMGGISDCITNRNPKK